MPQLPLGLYVPRFLKLGMVVILGLILGLGLLPVFAGYPDDSVLIISDPDPAILPGQFPEVTVLQANLLDPDPNWRDSTFDDSTWLNSYPASRLAGWGDPLADATTQADFIWGGSPGTGPDANGRFEIPAAPLPQFLFIRKNFCIPLNADIASVTAVNPLRLHAAATPGQVSVAYNGTAFFTNIPGDETGGVSSLALDPVLVNTLKRIGRNTLSLRVRDNVADTNAGTAFDLNFTYSIDSGAITLNSSPASPTVVNTAVTFSETNTGLSGDTPYTYLWDLGNGASSTDATPSVTYTAPGTYTVALTMTDRFGCISAPISTTHVVVGTPEISFSTVTIDVDESAGTATVTVVLSFATPLTVTVEYATSDGSATAGSDYSSSSGTLTIPANTTTASFTIPITDDDLVEGTETINLTLSNPSAEAILASAGNTAVLNIIDNDQAAVSAPSDDDDDDDDGGPTPTPTLVPTVAAVAVAAPTATPAIVTTLPETGVREPTLLWSNVMFWSVVIGVGLALGYYLIRRPRH